MRCEKDSNPYVKSCDKDNVGVVSQGEIGLCSEARCERFCAENRIPGGSEVSSQLNAHCMHYAWEPEGTDGLGECYIFSGCKDMSEDTYVTYLYEAPASPPTTPVAASPPTTPVAASAGSISVFLAVSIAIFMALI